MTTDVDVANVALARISSVAIGAFTDNSPAARAIARIYPQAKALMFAAMDWRFATAQAALISVAGVDQYPWAYTYLLPSECIRARMVVPGAAGTSYDNNAAPFQESVAYVAGVLTRVISCDLSPATLVYTLQVDDPALWDAGFMSAFTVQLAAELTLPITGNGQLAQAMRAEAQQAMAVQMPIGQAQAVTPMGRGPSTTTAARMAG